VRAISGQIRLDPDVDDFADIAVPAVGGMPVKRQVEFGSDNASCPVRADHVVGTDRVVGAAVHLANGGGYARFVLHEILEVVAVSQFPDASIFDCARHDRFEVMLRNVDGLAWACATITINMVFACSPRI
jgi:hypothetical protein